MNITLLDQKGDGHVHDMPYLYEQSDFNSLPMAKVWLTKQERLQIEFQPVNLPNFDYQQGLNNGEGEGEVAGEKQGKLVKLNLALKVIQIWRARSPVAVS